MNPEIEKRVYEVFIESVRNTKTSSEVVDFLNDLLSPIEKIMMAKRVAVAFLLLQDRYTYYEIAKTVKVSRGTIAKIHTIFALQGKGYRKILGGILKRKAAKSALSELLDILTPLPPKGANIGEWKKAKRMSKQKREESI
ncbi:MAG: Trp family transcriptional regulator [Candidatus Woesebacteria bacterium]|nr:Trp family transcriptional regulator [Candidatus Woesebacteria bacterium]